MKFVGNNKEIETQVDEYINAYVKKGQFSGAILIAKDGNILINLGYGMANYELDMPNTPKTKFMIGSVTKQFTAMASMQLSQKGLINVNDPIAKYIPDYPLGKKITIQHLLTNSSGIPNYTEFPEALEKKSLYFPLEKLIELFKHKPLEFTPGEKYSYSNSGYILLTYILEKVSGTSYESYVQKNIFKPLGMIHSGYAHHENILKNRASGYSMKNAMLINADYVNVSVVRGAGGLFSTIEDLYLWDQALYTQKLVTKEFRDKIFNSLIKTTEKETYYAYGWVITKLFNRPYMWHNGSIDGFRSYIGRCIDNHMCIIILSNYGFTPVENIASDLAAIVLEKPYEFPKERVAIFVDPVLYDAYVGHYELTPEFSITITKENNHLFAQATGQEKFEIFPESETKFFYKIVDAQISFIKDKNGKVSQLILHQDKHDSPGKKIR